MRDVRVRWSRDVLPPSAIIARSAQTISECSNSFMNITSNMVNHDNLKGKDEEIHVGRHLHTFPTAGVFLSTCCRHGRSSVRGHRAGSAEPEPLRPSEKHV